MIQLLYSALRMFFVTQIVINKRMNQCIVFFFFSGLDSLPIVFNIVINRFVVGLLLG